MRDDGVVAEPIRALTVYPEHAELFRLGIRTIETRGYSTDYRGPVFIHASKRDPDSAAARRDPIGSRALAAIPHGDPLPIGAVTSVAQLVEVAPIGGPYSFRTGIVQGDEGDFPDNRVIVRHPPMGDWSPESLCIDRPHEDITDQLPFGDFTPGRYGWVLADVWPLPRPVPAKGKLGPWVVSEELAEAVLSAFDIDGPRP